MEKPLGEFCLWNKVPETKSELPGSCLCCHFSVNRWHCLAPGDGRGAGPSGSLSTWR